MPESITHSSNPERNPPTINELYPALTPEQQQEAGYFLRRYISLIKRIYERVEREKQARQKAELEQEMTSSETFSPAFEKQDERNQELAE